MACFPGSEGYGCVLVFYVRCLKNSWRLDYLGFSSWIVTVASLSSRQVSVEKSMIT